MPRVRSTKEETEQARAIKGDVKRIFGYIHARTHENEGFFFLQGRMKEETGPTKKQEHSSANTFRVRHRWMYKTRCSSQATKIKRR